MNRLVICHIAVNSSRRNWVKTTQRICPWWCSEWCRSLLQWLPLWSKITVTQNHNSAVWANATSLQLKIAKIKSLACEQFFIFGKLEMLSVLFFMHQQKDNKALNCNLKQSHVDFFLNMIVSKYFFTIHGFVTGRMSNPAVNTARLADLEARIIMQLQLSFLSDQFDFDQTKQQQSTASQLRANRNHVLQTHRDRTDGESALLHVWGANRGFCRHKKNHEKEQTERAGPSTNR